MSKAKTTAVRLGTKMIPLDRLVPHPLNANVMPDDLRNKLKAHIARTGRYPFLVVRPHPTAERKYQVLDGHHRVEVLRELGHSEVRCDVWEVGDREAKILLATLNRLEGQDQPLRRAELVHALLAEIGVPDLAGLLPESEAELEELHSLLEFPAEEIAEQLAAQAEAAEKTLPVVLNFVLSPDQARVIEEAVEAASDGVVGRDRQARGLMALARHYLESS
jgi:ParB-like chromosome segregation protein Spo0J